MSSPLTLTSPYPVQFVRTDISQNYKQAKVSNYTLPPVFDFQFVLFGDIAPGWRLIKPLLLTLEKDEYDFYIFSDSEFLVYGYGETEEIARQDYINSLIDYYYIVKKQKDDSTLALFSYMKSYFFLEKI